MENNKILARKFLIPKKFELQNGDYFELKDGLIKVSDIHQKAKTDIQIATIYKHLKLKTRLWIKPNFYSSLLFCRVPNFYSTLRRVKEALSNILSEKLLLFPATQSEEMLSREPYFEIKSRICTYKVYQNTTIYRVLIDAYNQKITTSQSLSENFKKLQFPKVIELLKKLLKEEIQAINDYLNLI